MSLIPLYPIKITLLKGLIMFKYSDTNKRYHTLNYFLKHKFKCKVAKITLDGGFSCPNIDGTKGFGGCTYCDSSVTKHDKLSVQFNQVKSTLQKKWGDFCCIAYFAAHTNTYSDLATIKPMFEEVLHYDDVVGISVSTRADCLDDTVVNYFVS